MSAPKDWWSDLSSTRPGPARIRVTFNRDLTPAEQEHLRAVGKLIHARVRDKFRLSPDGRLYVESQTASSRQLFDAVAATIATSFVNVFPTAVRTFRERVVGPTPKSYAVGGTLAPVNTLGPITYTTGTTAAPVVEVRANVPEAKKKKKEKKK